MTKQNRTTLSAALAAMIVGFLFFRIDPAPAAAPPPPPRQPLEDTLADMDLTPEQRQKADAALAEMQGKQRQLHDDFLKQMAAILSPQQMQKLQQGGDQPPPPRGGQAGQSSATRPAASKDLPKGTVIFTGGFDTDPRDHGRPVVLVAAALDVSPDVFRKAFSGVTPASGGNEPQPDQVRKNKAALLKVLGPYGVTDDQLNAASNFYRYNGSKGEMWKTTPASATAVVANGVVTAIKLTDAGAGYSSPPAITVVGYEDLRATVELSFGTNTKTNGSIKSITINAAKK